MSLLATATIATFPGFPFDRKRSKHALQLQVDAILLGLPLAAGACRGVLRLARRARLYGVTATSGMFSYLRLPLQQAVPLTLIS